MKLTTKTTLAALVAGVMLVGLVADADARPRPPRRCANVDECTQDCREAARECFSAIRDDVRACGDEAGCDVLREDVANACPRGEERDQEVCDAARQAFRDCIAPCKDDTAADREACRAEYETCVEESCSTEE